MTLGVHERLLSVTQALPRRFQVAGALGTLVSDLFLLVEILLLGLGYVRLRGPGWTPDLYAESRRFVHHSFRPGSRYAILAAAYGARRLGRHGAPWLRVPRSRG